MVLQCVIFDILIDQFAMSNFVLRQNLSVLDKATYFTSLWSGEQTSSFNSSQARGWLTDLELVGTDGDKWSSVKVHKLFVPQVFPSLAEFLHENEDAKIVFPEVPAQVINSLGILSGINPGLFLVIK